jgi:predicted nucleic acid-binding protein
VTVVADSSPLILLSKVRRFDLLQALYPHILISSEVYSEVVVSGAGLPAALEVARAKWIEVRPIKRPEELLSAQVRFGLGTGELSTIILAKEAAAELALLDDYKARTLAASRGIGVRGAVGIIENLYRSGHLPDLREAFRDLLDQSRSSR